jgi:hypothetical protein
MIKELRMYWRLRPYINQFKEVTQMGKFSVHMLFQIISVLIGALVSIFGFLPPEAAKPVLCACIILSAVYG